MKLKTKYKFDKEVEVQGGKIVRIIITPRENVVLDDDSKWRRVVKKPTTIMYALLLMLCAYLVFTSNLKSALVVYSFIAGVYFCMLVDSISNSLKDD